MNTITKPAHAPTPWFTEADQHGLTLLCSGQGANSREVATINTPEDAALIVRAVNSHQALVDTVRECLDQISYLRGAMSEREQRATTPTTNAVIDQARAALALATT